VSVCDAIRRQKDRFPHLLVNSSFLIGFLAAGDAVHVARAYDTVYALGLHSDAMNVAVAKSSAPDGGLVDIGEFVSVLRGER